MSELTEELKMDKFYTKVIHYMNKQNCSFQSAAIQILFKEVTKE